MLGLFLLHGTTPFNDLPTMMMPMHGMEFSPLLDIQRSENRMIKYPHSAAEFLFTFTGEAIHRSDLRSDFYNQFFRTHGMERQYSQEELLEAVGLWLRTLIRRLEKDGAHEAN